MQRFSHSLLPLIAFLVLPVLAEARGNLRGPTRTPAPTRIAPAPASTLRFQAFPAAHSSLPGSELRPSLPTAQEAQTLEPLQAAQRGVGAALKTVRSIPKAEAGAASRLGLKLQSLLSGTQVGAWTGGALSLNRVADDSPRRSAEESVFAVKAFERLYALLDEKLARHRLPAEEIIEEIFFEFVREARAEIRAEAEKAAPSDEAFDTAMYLQDQVVRILEAVAQPAPVFNAGPILDRQAHYQAEIATVLSYLRSTGDLARIRRAVTTIADRVVSHHANTYTPEKTKSSLVARDLVGTLHFIAPFDSEPGTGNLHFKVQLKSDRSFVVNIRMKNGPTPDVDSVLAGKWFYTEGRLRLILREQTPFLVADLSNVKLDHLFSGLVVPVQFVDHNLEMRRLAMRAHKSPKAPVAPPAPMAGAVETDVRRPAADTNADLLLVRKVERNLDLMLESFRKQNSGWFSRLTGKDKVVRTVINAFRQEMNLGRKPTFEVWVEEQGKRKYLRGPNGESISRILWEALMKDYGLTESELERYLEIQRTLQETENHLLVVGLGLSDPMRELIVETYHDLLPPSKQ